MESWNRTNGITLLPCPFCGGEAEYGVTMAGEEVYCIRCGAAMPRQTSRAAAECAWNTRMHGTLTAEQVREAIFSGSVYASYDGAQYYANGIDMQVIADELNGLLGSGTCKNKATNLRTFWCDCCDCALEDWMDVGGKLVNGLRYCPNCGAKVVS